jgi:hypothetical protein
MTSREIPEFVAVPRAALAAVVDYMWPSEEADYCRAMPEDREGHVFEHLQTLGEALQAYLAV